MAHPPANVRLERHSFIFFSERFIFHHIPPISPSRSLMVVHSTRALVDAYLSFASSLPQASKTTSKVDPCLTSLADAYLSFASSLPQALKTTSKVNLKYEDERPVDGKRIGRTINNEFIVIPDDMPSKRNGIRRGNDSPGEGDRKRARHSYNAKTIKVELSFAAKIPMQSIAIPLKSQDTESTQEALRVLDIILRQHAAKQDCLLVRQAFFHDKQSNYTDLGGGVMACRRFHSSSRPVQGYVIFNLLRFLKRECWDPIRITNLMEAQGIRGPPYKFFRGNTAEANKLLEKSMNKPMELSHNILPKVQPHFHSWIKLYGRNVLTWYGPTPRLVVGEAEVVKEILSDREEGFPKDDPPEFMKKLLGYGLVTSNGKKWVRQRKLATHAFRSESLKDMIPAIVAAVEAMLQKWVNFEGKEIDLFKEFCILTSEIISRTAFGSSYIEGKDIFIKMDELTEIAARNVQAIRLPFFRKLMPNQDDMESEKIEEVIRESILKLIMRREERKKNGDDDDYGDDLLGSLIRAYHENESISLDDIIDECKTFYFVGQETTSMMLSWTSLLLAINTNWQDKIRLEVLQLFGDKSLTSEDFATIAKLRKMTMVINESMRLYPPVLNIFRTVAKDCRVGNVLLPKGMQIQISPLVIHHDRNTWGEDAQLFSPDRFAATHSGGDAFFPFGIGPRLCVGQGLAILEAKLALSMILQRYSFSLSPAYIHSPVSRLTCRPQHGLQVVLQRL